MDKLTIAVLLQRPLTPIEDTNFNTYIKIAKENLSTLICTDLCSDGSNKIYDARKGYRTVFTDVFNALDEVKIDGKTVESSEYSVRQWDKRNGSWCNSIVFKDRFCESEQEVEVSASWGFEKMPTDLQLVLAGLFDLISKKNTVDASIQSKQVEDFRITFRADVDLNESFTTKYAGTIAKYSMCSILDVQHGSVC